MGRRLILFDGASTFPHNQPEMTYDAALSGWRSYMDNAVYPDWESVISEYRTYPKRWDGNKEAHVKSLFKERDGAYIPIAPKSAILAIIEAFFAEVTEWIHRIGTIDHTMPDAQQRKGDEGFISGKQDKV